MRYHHVNKPPVNRGRKYRRWRQESLDHLYWVVEKDSDIDELRGAFLDLLNIMREEMGHD